MSFVSGNRVRAFRLLLKY